MLRSSADPETAAKVKALVEAHGLVRAAEILGLDSVTGPLDLERIALGYHVRRSRLPAITQAAKEAK
jgi:hypothetical protein